MTLPVLAHKFIIPDPDYISAGHLPAAGVVTIVLGGACWLVSEHDDCQE